MAEVTMEIIFKRSDGSNGESVRIAKSDVVEEGDHLFIGGDSSERIEDARLREAAQLPKIPE